MSTKKKIMIVEDDVDYLEQLKIMVESFGFETITATSQADAEKILEQEKPDLAILDVMMEREDSGFILAYKIKKKYKDVPVMILTALSNETRYQFEPEDEIEKKWIKADRYLEKGVRCEQLKREINKLLKL